MNPRKETFVNWLDVQLAKRGWTDYRLAKNAGISPAILYRARSGRRLPGYRACTAIAVALGISIEEVCCAAGLLPGITDGDRTGRLIVLLQQFTTAEQEEILTSLARQLAGRHK